MLRDVLELFRQAPSATLTPAAVAARLQISPALLEHMLRTLVRTGHLVEVEDCADCGSCPLTRICVGGIELKQKGYTLAR